METTAADKAIRLTPDDLEKEFRFSIFGALTGFLIRPRATFDRMRSAKRSHWWVVLVLIAAASALLAFANSTVRANMMQNMTLPEGFNPPEGITIPEGAQVAAASATISAVTILMSSASSTVTALAGFVLCSVVIFGLSLVMGGKATYKQLFPVAAWSALPLVLRSIVHACVTMITANSVAAGFSGLLAPMEALNMPLLSTLLGQFDVYLLWSAALLMTGIMVTSKLSRGKAVVAVLIYFTISAGLLLAASAGSSVISDTLGTNIQMPGAGRLAGPGRG